MINQFGNKFDKIENRPIFQISQKLAYIKTKNLINKKIINNKIYEVLKDKFGSELVELYFFKCIYDSILIFQNIVLLNPKKLKKKITVYIHPDNFFLDISMVEEIFPTLKNKIKIKVKSKIKFYFFVKKIIKFFYQITKKYLKKKNLNILNGQFKIAISANNIFNPIDCEVSQLKFSSLKNSCFLIYFKDSKMLKILGGERYINYIKSNNYNYIILNKINLINNNPFFEIENKIRSLKKINSIDLISNKISKDLIYNLNYWYSLFQAFNIKVHFDNTNHSKISIIKQIALKLNNGFSYTYQRSYPMAKIEQFAASFPVDYFFCMGEHSKRLWEKSYNYIENIIPVGLIKELKSKNIYDPNLRNFLKNKKNKTYNLIIFDTNHSYNTDNILNNFKYNFQLVDTQSMNLFYKEILDLLSYNDELRIIIKTKKISYLNKLSIFKKVINNKKIYIINNDNFELHQIKNYIDISISISFFTPSIFMESIACGIRSICYDYSNIFHTEKKYFLNNFNIKNIYSDIFSLKKDLLIDIRKCLNLKINRKFLIGNWNKKIIDEINYNNSIDGFKKMFKIIDKKYTNLNSSELKKLS